MSDLVYLPQVLAGPAKTIEKQSYGKCDVHTYRLIHHQVLVYEMKGYLAAQHIDEFVDDILAIAKAEKPRGMIADPREMKVLSPELQKAIQEKFWPGIARLGVRRNPGILPKATVTRTSTTRMVNVATNTISASNGAKVEITLLPTLEECLSWILQDDSPQPSAL